MPAARVCRCRPLRADSNKHDTTLGVSQQRATESHFDKSDIYRTLTNRFSKSLSPMTNARAWGGGALPPPRDLYLFGPRPEAGALGVVAGDDPIPLKRTLVLSVSPPVRPVPHYPTQARSVSTRCSERNRPFPPQTLARAHSVSAARRRIFYDIVPPLTGLNTPHASHSRPRPPFQRSSNYR